MGFRIGSLIARASDKDSRVEVTVDERGIDLYFSDQWHPAFAKIDADKARELGELLISAADNWDEITARLKHIEAERKRFESETETFLKGAFR